MNRHLCRGKGTAGPALSYPKPINTIDELVYIRKELIYEKCQTIEPKHRMRLSSQNKRNGRVMVVIDFLL